MEYLPTNIWSAGLIAVGLLLASLCFMPARPARAQDASPAEPDRVLAPTPELTPLEVINAQLVGLQTAADPDADPATGMRVVWNFAAPANREVTGPFERFDAMVRAEPYAVLVGHATHEIARLDQPEDRPVAQALVAVTDDDGNTTWFVWMLSKPAEGEAVGCWVTDAVYPVDVEQDPVDPGQIV
ncbi:MAG: hypothetical protein AAGF84_13230 [Planctomycetota bacterium]